MTISNEAVEAGAKATFEHTNEGCPWESVGTYWADVYRDAARAALEAAAPFIQAEALEEAADWLDPEGDGGGSISEWLRGRAKAERKP